MSATRAALEAEIRRVEDEQGRLVESIALAGDVAVLAAALKDREGRRAHLRHELAAITGAREIARFDSRRIETDLWKKVDDWRGMLRRQAPIARQMFAPDEEHNCYTFTGRATLGNLLTGLVFPKETTLPLVVRPQRVPRTVAT